MNVFKDILLKLVKTTDAILVAHTYLLLLH